MLKVDSLIAWNIGCAELEILFLCRVDRMIYIVLYFALIKYNTKLPLVPPPLPPLLSIILTQFIVRKEQRIISSKEIFYISSCSIYFNFYSLISGEKIHQQNEKETYRNLIGLRTYQQQSLLALYQSKYNEGPNEMYFYGQTITEPARNK